MTTEPSQQTLLANTDYLFCPVCEVHVPCLRLDSGGWEVQCPGCAGECGLCDCHLQRYCFGSREQFPPVEGVLRPHSLDDPSSSNAGPRGKR